MNNRPIMLLVLLVGTAGCSGSGSATTGSVVVAEQTIGPDGGTLLVETGAQEGLTLTVPPQALLEPVRFRVVDESFALPPEVRGLSYAPTPGLPFRIEPDDLFTRSAVTLRMPYRPGQVGDRAPGNVLVQQRSAFLPIDHEPEAVDVVDGYVQIRTREFGSFRVVPGPGTENVLDYVPDSLLVRYFESGYTFQILDAPPSLFGEGVTQWQITGPGFDESLFFAGRRLVGREAPTYRETWATGYDTFLSVNDSGMVFAMIDTIVEEPVGAVLSGAGAVYVLGYRQYSAPIAYGGLQRDVLKVVVDLSFEHPIGGSDTRQFTFWFAPEVGIVRLAIDGESFDRVP